MKRGYYLYLSGCLTRIDILRTNLPVPFQEQIYQKKITL